MKRIFIEARAKLKPDAIPKLGKNECGKLGKRVAIVSSVQFLSFLPALRENLEKHGLSVVPLKGRHSKYEGQVLGCDLPGKVDAESILYVGDGVFHAEGLALRTDKPVFVLNPTGGFFQIDHKKIEEEKKREKGNLIAFLSASRIGVIISTKPGQSALDQAKKLEKKYPDKEFYMLIGDTIDVNRLLDFKFVEVFVNSACPRLTADIREKGLKAIGIETALKL